MARRSGSKAALCFTLAASLLASSAARSFHGGGVGACDSCHSMHEARDRDASGSIESKTLLLASDPSSVCLNCHAGPGGVQNPSVLSTDGSAMTPGGDFYWLTKTFTWTGGSSSGDSHGHNVIALDFNLVQDLNHDQAPGGSYRSADLGCTSCHDPHGRRRADSPGESLPISVSGSYGETAVEDSVSGNYRLLGSSGYNGGGAAEGFRFNYDAPVARQNIRKKFGESDASHPDYGSGMSEWCGNCHNELLRNNHSATKEFAHASGSSQTLGAEIARTYNSYINTGELLALGGASGDAATSYLQFVPFERGTSNPQQLDPTSSKGPNSNSRVMCLSCHRAHSSAFQAIGRWDFTAVLLAESHPASGDGGLSGNDVSHSYYGRNISAEFGRDQGSFCQKCHGLALEAPLGSEPDQLFENVLDPAFDSEPEQLPATDPLLRNQIQLP